MGYMSNGAYKDRQLPVRIPAEMDGQLQALCQHLQTNPSTLIRVLLSQYIAAHAEHSGDLPWPPRFQYYDSAAITEPRRQGGKDIHAFRAAGTLTPYEGRSAKATIPTKAGSHSRKE